MNVAMGVSISDPLMLKMPKVKLGEKKRKNNVSEDSKLGSPTRNVNKKLAERKFIKCVQGTRSRVPFPNSVFTYKSYVSKYLMNGVSKDQIQYLGIFTRSISLLPHNLG